MIRANFHTHTTFSDGKNTPEEMVQTAISLQMTAIGFSDHSPIGKECTGTSGMAFESEKAYIAEIARLKNAYSDRLTILSGLEQDSNSPKTPYPYDYTIGSIHGIWADGIYRAVDYKEQVALETVETYFGGDHYAYAECYYRALAETANRYDPTFFGHFDLIAKYNEGGKYFDETHPRYRKAALEALEALIPCGKPFEVNTGAISRGVRTTPYPNPFILREMQAHGCRILLSGDSHSASGLLCAYEQATALAKSCGFTTALTLTNTGWQEEAL
ncbi:MAG: histidinol-phosphatase HisJ family protein [Ruminococcaceae bacterium]|nr:histidinol-phosphatase HisJ family protein [Oscillospiraceae bacterium]